MCIIQSFDSHKKRPNTYVLHNQKVTLNLPFCYLDDFVVSLLECGRCCSIGFLRAGWMELVHEHPDMSVKQFIHKILFYQKHCQRRP